MDEPNVRFFNHRSLGFSKHLILTPTSTLSVQERWELETPLLMNCFGEFIQPGHRVIDYGMGIGRLSLALLRKYHPTLQIYGIDASESMLKHCRDSYIPAGYFQQDKIRLFNLTEIKTIPSECADVILAVYVLQHISSAIFPEVLSQLNRLLKPSGSLFVFNTYQYCPVVEEDGELWYGVVKDSVNVEQSLDQHFERVKDWRFADVPFMEEIMANCFCRLYRKP
jgi:ubiquinone/menaquinone biosynthesis C-methylase UbiE